LQNLDPRLVGGRAPSHLQLFTKAQSLLLKRLCHKMSEEGMSIPYKTSAQNCDKLLHPISHWRCQKF